MSWTYRSGACAGSLCPTRPSRPCEMLATGWLRARYVEVLWVVFAALNVIAMLLTPDWETIPFHFIWVSLTILYGFRVWSLRSTSLVLAVVALGTGAVILSDAFEGAQLWGELFEVPLMSGMFLAMVWHARRRAAALREMECVATERAGPSRAPGAAARRRV